MQDFVQSFVSFRRETADWRLLRDNLQCCDKGRVASNCSIFNILCFCFLLFCFLRRIFATVCCLLQRRVSLLSETNVPCCHRVVWCFFRIEKQQPICGQSGICFFLFAEMTTFDPCFDLWFCRIVANCSIQDPCPVFCFFQTRNRRLDVRDEQFAIMRQMTSCAIQKKINALILFFFFIFFFFFCALFCFLRRIFVIIRCLVQRRVRFCQKPVLNVCVGLMFLSDSRNSNPFVVSRAFVSFY